MFLLAASTLALSPTALRWILCCFLKYYYGASLVANAGTRVRALVQEDPTCRGATKPVRHDS